LINIIDIINQPTIDIVKLKQATFRGIPENMPCGLETRAIVWRLLLKTWPLQPSEWE